MPNQDHEDPNEPAPPTTRAVGGTEYSWCKAVPQGTGTTVLALYLSKQPDLFLLKSSLHELQLRHPRLRSSLLSDPSTSTFAFIIHHPDNPFPPVPVRVFNLSETSDIIINSTTISNHDHHLSQFQVLLEHEMSKTTWSASKTEEDNESRDHLEEEEEKKQQQEVMFVSLYEVDDGEVGRRWVVVLRIHTVACDRVGAVGLLRELMELMCNGESGENVRVREVEGKMGIEEYIPTGKANKPFWARGADVLGYGLNALRLSFLEFVDATYPRCSQLVRLQLDVEDTSKVLEGCESNGIKLCGALTAAAMIAARSYKDIPDLQQTEKYSVVTLIDCRPLLEPVLTVRDVGFYHSGIVNSHDVKAEEKSWDLAKRCYTSFTNSKKNNKHFTDMGDLNFLMLKAIENPGLTPSSSQRTALLSVFEEVMVDDSSPLNEQLGVVDYIGCASIHGVGPSLAIFDTVRDGRLDCACVYPAPLHSRGQMERFVDDIKRILLEGCSSNLETLEN